MRGGGSGGGGGPGERTLCRLDEIPDGGARGFAAAPGGFIGLFAVRRGERVFVYVNSCPHVGLPLEPLPDRFLIRRRKTSSAPPTARASAWKTGFASAAPASVRRWRRWRRESWMGRLWSPADAGL